MQSINPRLKSERCVLTNSLAQPATPAAIVSEEMAQVAGQRATRRLLFIGIPVFWSSWYIYDAYFPNYARDLGASFALLGLIVAAYGLTQLLLRIPLGVACDRLGVRKPFVLAGAAIGALSSVVLLLAPQPMLLLLGRGLAGVAAACWVPLSALLVASYPKDQVSKATSMTTALSGLGTMVSVYVGGQIAQYLGVRVPFWGGIFLGVLAFVLLSRVKEPAGIARKPTSVASLLSVGKVGMVLLVSILALLGQYNNWATTQSFVPLYAAQLGADKAALASLRTVWQACNTLTCFFAGHVNARLGTRWAVVAGTMVIVLTTVLMPVAHSLPVLFVLRGLHGVGQGIAFPVLMAAALSAVSSQRRTAAMGFFQAIYAAGMVLGPVVSGLFADSLGFAWTFYLVGALSLIATVAAAVLLPHRVHSAEADA